jgi:hypothetical protein
MSTNVLALSSVCFFFGEAIRNFYKPSCGIFRGTLKALKHWRSSGGGWSGAAALGGTAQGVEK